MSSTPAHVIHVDGFTPLYTPESVTCPGRNLAGQNADTPTITKKPQVRRVAPDSREIAISLESGPESLQPRMPLPKTPGQTSWRDYGGSGNLSRISIRCRMSRTVR